MNLKKLPGNYGIKIIEASNYSVFLEQLFINTISNKRTVYNRFIN